MSECEIQCDLSMCGGASGGARLFCSVVVLQPGCGTAVAKIRGLIKGFVGEWASFEIPDDDGAESVNCR